MSLYALRNTLDDAVISNGIVAVVSTLADIFTEMSRGSGNSLPAWKAHAKTLTETVVSLEWNNAKHLRGWLPKHESTLFFWGN